jgi:hypothetical protein
MKKLLLAGAAIIMLGWLHNVPSSTTATEPERKMENAAEIGDTLQLKNPASMILCESRDDSFKVYFAGELALNNSLRMGDSAWTAVSAQSEARKSMMARAYSCMLGTRLEDQHFTVQEKRVTGEERDALRVATYRLRSVETNVDWWFEETRWLSSEFKNVKPTIKTIETKATTSSTIE